MPIHFTDDEMQRRRRLVVDAVRAAELDALLMFKQESMYWLTGYNTFGFSMFQCLVMTANGDIALLTRAADLADDAWDAAAAMAAGGVSEADILAEMQGAIFRGGGDYAGNELIIGSGPGALMVRYTSGRRTLDSNDQLTLEWCGVQRRYHAAMLLVGEPHKAHIEMHSACNEALLACEAAIRPGATLGSVFDTHATVLDDRGWKKHRMNACGYGMGAVYAPIWVDWPMLYEGNPLTFEPDQVYFLHMIILDLDEQRAMSLGHSVIVTEDGCERLSRSSLDLVVNQ